MKRIHIALCNTIIVGALLSGQASAESTDLWRLLGDGNNVFVLSGGEAVYQIKSGNRTVNVGASVNAFVESDYTSLGLTAFKFTGKLDKNELALFSQGITKLATKCFNLDSARVPSIQNWIVTNSVKEAGASQTAQIDSAEANFGPLKLTLFKRGSRANGQTVTIIMERQGTPGELPWVNYCGLSG